MKIRVGIIFGGNSREREISFAGGRTVYDNLNKSLFEPVPLFVDSYGNFILLDWHFIYKGSIRDFYPPVDHLPTSANEYQIYAESLNSDEKSQDEIINKLGKKVRGEELKNLIDFAFLCLHGTNGEDGRVQGLLEYVSVPYSGSGILSSAIGINKAVQKQLMAKAGFATPSFITINREEWFKNGGDKNSIYKKALEKVGVPFVVKAATQGSSIGISIIHEENINVFEKAVNKSFFTQTLSKPEWERLNSLQQVEFVRTLSDIREGLGVPLQIRNVSSQHSLETVYHPEVLLNFLQKHFTNYSEDLLLEAFDAESEVIIEQFIEGKEFSCIVVQDEKRNPIALPPTEIRKGKELFDYRSKYLPGLSRKITPINLPSKDIEMIRQECEKLFEALHFNVYARIDGFITKEGKVFLNDPNTTSGMMPSSFFFHQAAEIGLNPSQFLTYIIRTALTERIKDMKNYSSFRDLLVRLDSNIEQLQKANAEKIKIAVIFGGYSSERHISVESGRNVYEKLASSTKYEPIPVFLSGSSEDYYFHQVPINLLLKDNADDIKEKIEHFEVHPVIKEIIEECSSITLKYSSAGNIAAPKKLSYNDLAEMCDGVFIALHGRPGEDGDVQRNLEKVGLPYNGSSEASSKVTINKYETNEILMSNGFNAARHSLKQKNEWLKDKQAFLKGILDEYKFPFIVKPVDDGCSSAVKKIKNEKELAAFVEEIFRDSDELIQKDAEILNLKPKEEFPKKNVLLVEELITSSNASHFLEITGGLLTHYDQNGNLVYEMFEASEALSEGDVLSLEEKFLAGQGLNITPARYSPDPKERDLISENIKRELEKAARLLNVQGYARIDAFVRIFDKNKVELVFVEVNSLPGMTPATCIFHQCAINGYKPYEFIDKILEFGFDRRKKAVDHQIVN